MVNIKLLNENQRAELVLMVERAIVEARERTRNGTTLSSSIDGVLVLNEPLASKFKLAIEYLRSLDIAVDHQELGHLVMWGIEYALMSLQQVDSDLGNVSERLERATLGAPAERIVNRQLS